jgi:hypothetical protein
LGFERPPALVQDFLVSGYNRAGSACRPWLLAPAAAANVGSINATWAFSHRVNKSASPLDPGLIRRRADRAARIKLSFIFQARAARTLVKSVTAVKAGSQVV